jgi:hypothetical protein
MLIRDWWEAEVAERRESAVGEEDQYLRKYITALF